MSRKIIQNHPCIYNLWIKPASEGFSVLQEVTFPVKTKKIFCKLILMTSKEPN